MKVNYILFVVISMFSLIYTCCLVSSCTKATCNSKITYVNNSNDIITEVENDNVVNTDNNVYTPWVLVASDVVTTVYNAVPNQCDSTPNYTASGFKLDLTNVAAHKIIAMERTFMKELGLKYGDVVKIEGTGKYDGVWQIQDTMNKRYAGQHKIDLLVDKSIKLGKWTNVKLYVLADKELTEFFKKDFASSL
jgi:hypothetical protein